MVASLVLGLTACGTSKNAGSTNAGSTVTPTKEASTNNGGGDESSNKVDPSSMSLDQLTIGEYADTTATIRFMTQRTDLLEEGNWETMKLLTEYAEEFNKIYPNTIGRAHV